MFWWDTKFVYRTKPTSLSNVNIISRTQRVRILSVNQTNMSVPNFLIFGVIWEIAYKLLKWKHEIVRLKLVQAPALRFRMHLMYLAYPWQQNRGKINMSANLLKQTIMWGSSVEFFGKIMIGVQWPTCANCHGKISLDAISDLWDHFWFGSGLFTRGPPKSDEKKDKSLPVWSWFARLLHIMVGVFDIMWR